MSDQQVTVKDKPENQVEVVVITTSGSYPTTGTEKVPANQKVSQLLAKAAKHLGIVDTNGWIARVNGREIDPEKSYTDNQLSGVVKIDYHKREGGGGHE